jgi:hypothetical protein
MVEVKEGPLNQDKIKFDKGKPRLALVPSEAIKAIGVVMSHGIDKYYEDSWKEVEPARWRDALMRHWCEYIDDPYGVDTDSGLPHLWHILTNAAFLCHLESPEQMGLKQDTVKLHKHKLTAPKHGHSLYKGRIDNEPSGN